MRFNTTFIPKLFMGISSNVRYVISESVKFKILTSPSKNSTPQSITPPEQIDDRGQQVGNMDVGNAGCKICCEIYINLINLQGKLYFNISHHISIKRYLFFYICIKISRQLLLLRTFFRRLHFLWPCATNRKKRLPEEASIYSQCEGQGRTSQLSICKQILTGAPTLLCRRINSLPLKQ